MEKENLYNISGIKKSCLINEKCRKDILENYLEYGICLIYKLKEEGKDIDDILEHMKRILWFIKNERAQQIENELGISH